MYGVSYGNLGKLKKKIKTDQEVAEGLWASGNHDAMVLATMVADPAQVKSSQLDAWARDLASYVLTDAFCRWRGRPPSSVPSTRNGAVPETSGSARPAG